jgi:hypothetical protein
MQSKADSMSRLLWVSTLIACSIVLLAIVWPTATQRFYVEDDLGNFTIPIRHFYQQGLQSGRIDLWCPNLFGGYYLHGEGQDGMMHPLHLVLYRFLPLVEAFGAELLCIYISLFAGSYLLFRRWNVEPVCAAFGAFVFSFAGNNLLAIVHVNRIAVIAHAPWAMLAIDSCMRGRYAARIVGCAGIALLNGSALLFGYPYFFLMSLALQSWYMLYLASGGLSWSRILMVLGGMVMALPIGAIQIIPTWTTLAGSTRVQPTLAFLSYGSLHPMQLLQWANPFLFRGRKIGLLGAHELAIYAGIGPLLVFIWLCARKTHPDRRLVWFLAGLAITGIVLAFGRYNPAFSFYAEFPLIRLFRVPARYILFTHFALAGGAALGLDRLRRYPRIRPSARARFLLFAGLSVGLGTLGLKAAGEVLPFLAKRFAPVSDVIWGSVLICLGIGLFRAALSYGTAAFTMFWVFSLFDLTAYSISYLGQLQISPMSYFTDERPPVPPPGPVSMENSDRLLPAGYRLAGGYVGLPPLGLLRTDDPLYLRLLGTTAVQKGNSWRVIGGEPPAPLRIVHPVATKSPLEALARVDLFDTAVVTQPVQVGEGTEGSVRIIEQHPGFVRAAIDTPGRALCLFVQRYHPGWTARIGTRKLEVIRANGDFIGFIVPGGSQEVTLQFAPSDFRLGKSISLLALAATVGWGAIVLMAGHRKASSKGHHHSHTKWASE